ncbi:hypothetical protein E2K80_05455 [Rhodophyticola sp. CCM32]|uniref:TfoX/Sxy family protein n=1 Tax=Rhodophyticola sp. CCM32 TaxID=2916397 RepID=UPI00107F2E97|nr:TfoX/Sxy family protein [Rhodophyticola sp. CCM32]QBY00250.1 hypothetical protein E2K80_05455 [Rhodophyticola sp. CCM32]
MPHNPDMAKQMRQDLGDLEGLTEQKMFGGLCYLHHGNMIGGVGPKGALYRTGKGALARALTLPGTTQMEMGGRKMGGFARLSNDAFADETTRLALTRMALDFVTTLPPKAPRS